MIATILYTVECKEFMSIKIKSSKIYLYFLDHNGLILTIRLTKTKPKGKGFWKFNASIIKHESLKAGFAKFLKNWQQEQYRYKSVNLWWEAGKIFQNVKQPKYPQIFETNVFFKCKLQNLKKHFIK